MKGAIQQIIDVIDANKTEKGMIIFIQEIKGILSRHAKDPQIAKNLTNLVLQLKKDPENAEYAAAVEIEAQKAGQTKKIKIKNYNFGKDAWGAKAKERPRSVPAVDKVIPANSGTQREDEPAVKRLYEIYSAGKEKATENGLEEFIKVAEAIGCEFGENKPVEIETAWGAFELYVRKTLKI